MSKIEMWSIVIGIILGGSAILGFLLKKVSSVFKKWTLFLRDWEGEQASEGRDAIPGVMERINRLDGELSHNGGSSLKDIVFRIAVRQDHLERKLEEAEIARQQNQIILLEAIQTIKPKKSKI
jgi:hypothetical protein